MILIVSDLHLTDRADRTPFATQSLIATLETTLQSSKAAGVTEVQLILLGDIFEILKSDAWFEVDARPWCPGNRRVAAVERIVEGIIAVNGGFFAELKRLADTFGLRLRYVFGNHDYQLSLEDNAAAYQRLRSHLPLPVRPEESVLEPRCGLWAEHGHNNDARNRYRGDKAAVGDAIVVELLVGLPRALQRHFGLPADHVDLRFADGLDTLLPESPRTHAEWLLTGLDALRREHSDADTRMKRAINDVLDGIHVALQQAQFERPAVLRRMKKVLRSAIKVLPGKRSLLQIASTLTLNEDSPPHSYRGYVKRIVDRSVDQRPRIVALGHTHVPERVHVPTQGPPAIYLNSGTWRLVRERVARNDRTRGTFVPRQERCLLLVHDPDEQALGLPAYAFQRVETGAEGAERGASD